MDNDNKLPECFVAMWFGSDSNSEAEMDQLYDLVIKPAIEEQGLFPYHVGRDFGANKLDDAILEAIDRAVLVVVDLTHNRNTGLRGSVVFEAGYAYRTKPVIWMCRDDLANAAPFDIRQFRQIRWDRNKLIEARKQLATVIGERIKERQTQKIDHELSRFITDRWNRIMSMTDVDIPEGDGVISADQLRFLAFQEFCANLKTRVKYKDMGLSQNEKYELIELVRGFRIHIRLLKSQNRLFGKEQYKEIVYPRLRASGWIA